MKRLALGLALLLGLACALVVKLDGELRDARRELETIKIGRKYLAGGPSVLHLFREVADARSRLGPYVDVEVRSMTLTSRGGAGYVEFDAAEGPTGALLERELARSPFCRGRVVESVLDPRTLRWKLVVEVAFRQEAS